MNPKTIDRIAKRVLEVHAPSTVVDSLDDFYESSDNLFNDAVESDDLMAVVDEFHGE